jgi:hypothetical protein
MESRDLTHNYGQRWSDETDVELRKRIDARQSVGQIARDMGRTQDAIRGRAATLRLSLPSTRRPWREGVKRGPRMQRPDPSSTGEN